MRARFQNAGSQADDPHPSNLKIVSSRKVGLAQTAPECDILIGNMQIPNEYILCLHVVCLTFSGENTNSGYLC